MVPTVYVNTKPPLVLDQKLPTELPSHWTGQDWTLWHPDTSRWSDPLKQSNSFKENDTHVTNRVLALVLARGVTNQTSQGWTTLAARYRCLIETSLVRYGGTITELVRLCWMLKSLLMIVTATCCIAFYDNVYLQHLATMSTFQIKHLPMLFSQVSYDDLWNSSRCFLDVFNIYYRGTTHTETKQSYTQ